MIVTRAGYAPLRIRCSGAACRGTVALFTARGVRLLTARKPVKLGLAQFSIARGKTKTVRVKLSRRTMRTLRRVMRLRVQAVVTLRQASGRRTVTRPKLVLKAPARR